jgi:hypothetical protein
MTMAPPAGVEREIVVVVPIATTPPVVPDSVGETGAVAVAPAAGPISLVSVADVTITIAITVAVTNEVAITVTVTIEVTTAVADDAVSQIVSIPIPAATIAITKSLTQILSICEVAAGLVATTSRRVISHLQKVADLALGRPAGLVVAASLVEIPAATVFK